MVTKVTNQKVYKFSLFHYSMMTTQNKKLKKTCIQCGKEFYTDCKHSYQKYCSIPCGRLFCRKEINQKAREAYRKYPKRFIANTLRWQRAHPETVKKYEIAHKKQRRARQRKWYQNHRKENIAKVIKYSHTLIGRAKLRFRALKYQKQRRGLVQESHLLFAEDQTIRKKFKKCIYCSSVKNLTLEHIIALKRKGKDVPENCVMACRSCNASKKKKNVFSWCKKKGKEVPEIIIALLKKQNRKNYIPSNFYIPSAYLNLVKEKK